MLQPINCNFLSAMDVPYTPKTVYQDDYDNREFIALAAQAGN